MADMKMFEIRDGRYIELRQRINNQGYKLLIDTQEKMIRDALIRLGWTPPDAR